MIVRVEDEEKRQRLLMNARRLARKEAQEALLNGLKQAKEGWYEFETDWGHYV